MKISGALFSVLAVAMLSGCMHLSGPSPAQVLNRTQAVGSPFTVALTEEYRRLAHDMRFSVMGGPDSNYFIRKGQAAAEGVVVMPEKFENSWYLSSAENAALATGRSDLLDLLAAGGRDRMPFEAAYAQSRFDCWSSQAQRSFSGKEPSCKQQFTGALESLRTGLGKANEAARGAASALSDTAAAMSSSNAVADESFPPPITSSTIQGGALTPIDEAMFIVFFDWNQSNLSPSAHDVIDAIAQELLSRQDIQGVVIAGHADTSGTEKYNQNLSRKRAEVVQAALIARGVSPALLKTQAHGESRLLVPTPDNVREPGNRRAEITLE